VCDHARGDCQLRYGNLNAGADGAYNSFFKIDVSGFTVKPTTAITGRWNGPPQCAEKGEISSGQCTFPIKDAPRACIDDPNCVGFTCNNDRMDCQLRYAPLEVDPNAPSYTSFTKTPSSCTR